MSTGGTNNGPPRAWAPGPGTGVASPPPMALIAGEATEDERLFAAAAHGLTFFEGGIVGPLAVYLLKKQESEFVAFHALQSLYFGLAFFALSFVTCGIAVFVLIWPYLIFEMIATLRAFDGEWYELPLVGRLARRRHPGPRP